MTRLETKHLGELDYTEDCLLTFPSGLAGFERHRRFVFLTTPETVPLVSMQSLDDRELCFILLPILTIDPDYGLEMSPDDLEEIGLPLGRQPRIGEDAFCAALICAGSGAPPTANLLAPVVVNLANRVGMQVIQSASGYSHQHPLLTESATCS
jgi:flagellar assembly factor FliW